VADFQRGNDRDVGAVVDVDVVVLLLCLPVLLRLLQRRMRIVLFVWTVIAAALDSGA
jgi:hypothetical protein